MSVTSHRSIPAWVACPIRISVLYDHVYKSSGGPFPKSGPDLHCLTPLNCSAAVEREPALFASNGHGLHKG